MGIRGIPACYSDFKALAEELATRLAKKGHEASINGRLTDANYLRVHGKKYEKSMLAKKNVRII